MRIHYLSDLAQQAAQLTPSATPAKVRAGWVWHRLVPGFCTTGGAGSYSRALISAEGQIAFVSDRAQGPAASEIEATLELDHTMVRLTVPFAEKEAAKALGAVWIGHHKTWACSPERVPDFARWADKNPNLFDVLDENVGEHRDAPRQQ